MSIEDWTTSAASDAEGATNAGWFLGRDDQLDYGDFYAVHGPQRARCAGHRADAAAIRSPPAAISRPDLRDVAEAHETLERQVFASLAGHHRQPPRDPFGLRPGAPRARVATLGHSGLVPYLRRWGPGCLDAYVASLIFHPSRWSSPSALGGLAGSVPGMAGTGCCWALGAGDVV